MLFVLFVMVFLCDAVSEESERKGFTTSLSTLFGRLFAQTGPHRHRAGEIVSPSPMHDSESRREEKRVIAPRDDCSGRGALQTTEDVRLSHHVTCHSDPKSSRVMLTFFFFFLACLDLPQQLVHSDEFQLQRHHCFC